MIRVIIIDDEPLILRGIKQMIEYVHSDFKVVAEFTNGSEALENIKELKPDVIFTDIKMPVLDGLELIENFRAMDVGAFIVILSGHQEFEYARKALKYGVLDYLLKPLSPCSVKKILDNIYTKKFSDIRKKQVEFLNNIVGDSFIPPEMLASATDIFESGRYYLLLICAGSYCTFPYAYPTPAKDFWFKLDIEEIMSKYLPQFCSCWIIDGLYSNEKICLLKTTKNNSLEFHEIVVSVFSELSSLNFPITAAANECIDDITQIGTVFQKTRIMLNKNILFAKSNLIFGLDIYSSPTEEASLFDVNMEKTLSFLVQNLQIDKLKQVFSKLLDSCEKSSYRQMNLEGILKHFINTIYQVIPSVTRSKMVEIDMEINEIISNSYTYQSLFDGVCFIVDELIGMFKTKNSEDIDQKALIDKVELYIINNFTKQINSQTLSDTFGLVGPYISKLFKKYKGISPNDYIIDLRIEKAKELLLLDPSVSLTNISETIGFNDRFYFSKVFKAVTGRSPSEFREENKKSQL